MFRTLGLRHLCVINRHHQVLGIVTRADLVAAHGIAIDDAKVFVRTNNEGSDTENNDSPKDHSPVDVSNRKENYESSPSKTIEMVANASKEMSSWRDSSPTSPIFDYNYPTTDMYRNGGSASRRNSINLGSNIN